MNIVLTIVIAVLAFGVIIFIHELGHFLMAKAMKVKVNEFAIGMGPTLVKFQRGETRYAIRLLPIGGFVSMEGEDTESDDERAFGKKKPWRKILIVVAGAIMNIVLGFVLLLSLSIAKPILPTSKIASFAETATSNADGGLMAGDVIKKINGVSIGVDNDIVFELMRDKDGIVDMTVVRDGEKLQLNAVRFAMSKYEDKNSYITLDFKIFGVEKTFLGTIKYAANWTYSVARMVIESLFDLITGRFGFNQMSGPVGITTTIGEAASQGLTPFLLIIAFITVNVGVFNLLPLPALDGGRLIFLIVELFRGKPVPAKYENYVHGIGLLLLFALMIIVTFNDIIRIVRG